MRSGPSSHLARPLRHSSAWLAANSSGDICLPGRFALVDPRPKVARRQVRKREQQVAQVALGIDRDGRDAVERRLFQQRHAQPRLAAARHADADGVGREVLAVVKQRLGMRLAGRQIVRPAEVERAELVDVGHHTITVRS